VVCGIHRPTLRPKLFAESNSSVDDVVRLGGDDCIAEDVLERLAGELAAFKLPELPRKRLRRLHPALQLVRPRPRADRSKKVIGDWRFHLCRLDQHREASPGPVRAKLRRYVFQGGDRITPVERVVRGEAGVQLGWFG
jgi:hypothetical protein